MAKKTLAVQLQELSENQRVLVELCRRLIAHTEVIAIATRTPDRVPGKDLDAAIEGLHQLGAQLIDG